jgi:hypothetical protein
MDDDLIDNLMDTRSAATPSTRHALLMAALLHLMSQYTLAEREGCDEPAGERPCVKLASVIQRHLDALARLPDAEPVLRATCEQLSLRWADLVDSRLPRPARRPLLARLLGHGRQQGVAVFSV